MDESASVNKSKVKLDKNILDLFWKLCEHNSQSRINACADILHAIWKKQISIENANELVKDLEYCVERLVRGLASPRDSARLGYTLLLTEILIRFPIVQVEEVLELMKKHLSIFGKQEKKDIIFGQLFAYTAIVRSGRLPNHTFLSEVVLSLLDLSFSRNYILNATYEVIIDLFSQLSSENFKEVWSRIKKKLPSNWESLSAETLWLLLLCIRQFPNAISSKYMEKHWGKDVFSSENLDSLKKIMKQTTSSLPKLHPTCKEVVLLIKQRTNFQEIWNSIIDDNLFIEYNEKTFVGFEMLKFALDNSPTEEMLSVVFSPKFKNIFLRSFLNTKHPLNPAASQLADYLSNFVTLHQVPNLQIMILKVFFQPSETVLLNQIMKKKEVSLIIQKLKPNAVKELCKIFQSIVLQKKSDQNDAKDVNNMTRFQAIQQVSNLIAHPAVLTDTEWRVDAIKFLFFNSFFITEFNETNPEIPHRDSGCEPLSDALRESCMTAFFKAVNSFHARSEKQSSLTNFVNLLMQLVEYAEVLMSTTGNVKPMFSVEKVMSSWGQLKAIVHKLKKKSKKDNLAQESNAFLVLFLQLGLHLLQDPDGISDVLEELIICCKKSLKSHKDESNIESGENEPPWIGVLIDILLSLLSRPSHNFRSLVTYIFPHFCSFIDENALSQILDVINPTKNDEDMLVEDDDSVEGEDANALDFGSGSSSEDSEDDAGKQTIDEGFRKKVHAALGPAAEESEAESIVLSDTEMFKLDSALSEAFKGRVKAGHTQIKSEDKALLHFRVRCLDLILAYLKSDPPMHLVLMCLEPILAAFEHGHKVKHQGPLLHKAVSVLQFMTKMRKFQHHDNVSRTELKRLLDVLIPKCHKEINLSNSQKLSSLCVFIVLCYRKVANAESPDKKKSKTPSYIKIYFSALETFVTSSSTHMLPQFFTYLMEACPDVASYFIEPCKNYAFNNNTRLFKRTQCLGLLSESLKYSKSQKDITDEQWYEISNSILPFAIESLKAAFESEDIKPTYCTELLNIIYTSHQIIKEKTNESLLGKYSELLPLLTNTSHKKMKKLKNKGIQIRNRIITCLGGSIKSIKATNEADENDQTFDNEKASIEENASTSCVNNDLQKSGKKKKKRKSSEFHSTHMNSCESEITVVEPEKSKARQSSKKRKKSKELYEGMLDSVNSNLSNSSVKKCKKSKKSVGDVLSP